MNTLTDNGIVHIVRITKYFGPKLKYTKPHILYVILIFYANKICIKILLFFKRNVNKNGYQHRKGTN